MWAERVAASSTLDAVCDRLPELLPHNPAAGREVLLAYIWALAESGKPVNHDTVRDAIQEANLQTLQGVISFDQYGDIKNHVVSVFQCHHNPQFADDNVLQQC